MIEYDKEILPDIFNFHTFKDYFSSILNHFKNSNTGPRSYGEWAKRLGYKSPRSFGMIASGERLPSEEMLFSLSKYLKLTRKRRTYLEILVTIERRKKSDKPIDELFIQLSKLNPLISSFQLINDQDFSHISKWYYLVIRQILKHEMHESELCNISSYLDHKISLKEIKSAINTLIDLNLVNKNKDGIIKSTNKGLNTKSDIPSSAVTQHHYGMLDQAKAHLNDGIHDREYQTLTFRCQKEDMKEAKEAIRQFKEDFNKRFSSNKGDEVYQLNLQFFQHTKLMDQYDKKSH